MYIYIASLNPFVAGRWLQPFGRLRKNTTGRLKSLNDAGSNPVTETVTETVTGTETETAS